MEITRCEKGHFYDSDRFHECPYCNKVTEINATKPLSGVGSSVANGQNEESKTIGFFDYDEVDLSPEKPTRNLLGGPVVGWLVATEGVHKGKDFPLKSGKNFIGRSTDMDVTLENDKTVSRDRHAIVIYDPKSNIFLVTPGDARELFYINDEVVLAARQIVAYDVIALGKSKLTFVPFCCERFQWNAGEQKNPTAPEEVTAAPAATEA